MMEDQRNRTSAPCGPDTLRAAPRQRDDISTSLHAVPPGADHDEGPDRLFNHYRRRRLLALGVPAAESAR